MKNQLSETDISRLNVLMGILFRSFLIGTGAIIFCLIVMKGAEELVLNLEQTVSGLTAEQLVKSNYEFLILIKCLNVTFFFFPSIAIWHFLRGQKSSS